MDKLELYNWIKETALAQGEELPDIPEALISILRRLREALAAEPSAAADAAVLRAIEKAAAENAAKRKTAPRRWRTAWLRGPAAGLLAASLAAIAFVHMHVDAPSPKRQSAQPQTTTNAPAAAAAADSATTAFATSTAKERDAAQFTMDEADIMLELTSMSQDCLIL